MPISGELGVWILLGVCTLIEWKEAFDLFHLERREGSGGSVASFDLPTLGVFIWEGARFRKLSTCGRLPGRIKGGD